MFLRACSENKASLAQSKDCGLVMKTVVCFWHLLKYDFYVYITLRLKAVAMEGDLLTFMRGLDVEWRKNLINQASRFRHCNEGDDHVV